MLKKGIMLLILMTIVAPVVAISPFGLERVKEAQEYGKKNGTVNLTEFMRPWTAYEEKAVATDERAETAYFYTPFALVANDAWEKARRNQVAATADGEGLVRDYAGFWVFSVMLLGNDPSFAEKVKAVLRQEKNIVEAYQVTSMEILKTPWYPQQPQYTARCYLYFKEPPLMMQRAVNLVITANDRRERLFYFDLSRVP